MDPLLIVIIVAISYNAPAIYAANGTDFNLTVTSAVLEDGGDGDPSRMSRLRWLDSGNNSWYNGLQVNAEKRMSHGLLINVAYTYSQSLGEAYVGHHVARTLAAAPATEAAAQWGPGRKAVAARQRC